MAIVPALSQALMKASNTSALNIMLNNGATAGQGKLNLLSTDIKTTITEVFHSHFHIIPRSSGDYMSSTWCGWKTDKLGSHILSSK